MYRLKVRKIRGGGGYWSGYIVNRSGRNVRSIVAPDHQSAIDWGCAWLHMIHQGWFNPERW